MKHKGRTTSVIIFSKGINSFTNHAAYEGGILKATRERLIIAIGVSNLQHKMDFIENQKKMQIRL